MTIVRNLFFAFLASALIMLSSCQQPGVNSTGSEYMPDMAHSVAYEANVHSYYSLNTWDSLSVVKSKEMSEPRKPVDGTVPRGYAGVYFAMESGEQLADEQDEVMNYMYGETPGSKAVPVNGKVPFYYGDSEEERTRAIAEIIENPYPITAEGLAHGKELYDIFCGICHGEKGDGAGYLVRDPDPATGDAGGKYPAAPANFLLDEHVNASNGRYYYAIMYGKNVMGAYKDKLNYEERWQVIHYIRSLQAKDQSLAYSEEENTLNPAFGVPVASLDRTAMEEMPAEETMEQEGNHGEEMHGGEADHDSEDASHSGDDH